VAGGGAIVIGGRRGPRVRRAAVLTAVTLGIVGGVLMVGNFLFQRATAYDVPSGKRPALELGSSPSDRGLTLGQSRAARRFGLWVLHLAGDDYGLGWARGRLFARLGSSAERRVRQAITPAPTGWLRGKLRRMSLRWSTRGLPGGLDPAFARELAGLARGLGEGGAGAAAGEGGAPSFRELVYEQVTFDRGAQPLGLREADPRAARRLSRSALAFAGRGAAPEGHLWVGASLRLGSPTEALEPVVEFIRPDAEGSMPHAVVTWPGQVGALAGMNQAGLVVVVVPARARFGAPGGEPVAALGRALLARASTLGEAQQLLRTRKGLAAASFLLASGREGEAIVVERTPRRLAVRRADAGGGVWSAGHFTSPEFESDGDNDRMRRYGVSGARHQRLGELVAERRGVLDAQRALEVLRDRRAVGGAELPLGHPAALLSTSARPIVFDASALIMWVGEGPGALGALRAFDVRHELAGPGQATAGAAPPADLPADAALDSAGYRDLVVADAALADAVRMLAAGKRRLAVEALRRAVSFAPSLPGAHKLLADVLRAQRDAAGARAEYQRFLELSPPYLDEVEEVRAWLGTP